MDTGDPEKLDIDDLESVAGGESYYDAVHNVFWDIYRMKQQGKTQEETYAYCEERYSAHLPQLEATILAYLKDIYADPTI